MIGAYMIAREMIYDQSWPTSSCIPRNSKFWTSQSSLSHGTQKYQPDYATHRLLYQLIIASL